MKFLSIIAVYLLSTGFCIALDSVWLTTMKNFYFEQLAHLAKTTSQGALVIHLPIAIAVWFLITLGIACFVIPPVPALPTLMDALRGALFGFIVYGVYDLTNAATLKDWSLLMTLIDCAWGTVLCAATAYFMRFLYALIL